MKIIEAGKPTKKIKCSICNSKLEIEPIDVSYMQSEDGTILKQYVVCPVCQARINLSGADTFPAEILRTF